MKLRVPLLLRHGDCDGDGDDGDDGDDDDRWSIGAIPLSMEPVKPAISYGLLFGRARLVRIFELLSPELCSHTNHLSYPSCPHTAHPHAVRTESIRSTALTTHPPKSFSLAPCAC
jgi:hypothetical protein